MAFRREWSPVESAQMTLGLRGAGGAQQANYGAPAGKYGLSFARRGMDRAVEQGQRERALGLDERKVDLLESGALGEAMQGLRGAFAPRAALAATPGMPTMAGSTSPYKPSAAAVVDDGDEALKQGGPVRGLRKVGKGPDNVPMWATEGEYMLPVETVEKIGEENLDAVVRETTGEEPGGQPKKGLRGYERGGRIEDITRRAMARGNAELAQARAAQPVIQPTQSVSPTPGVTVAESAAPARSGLWKGVKAAGRFLATPITTGASLLLHSGDAGAAADDDAFAARDKAAGVTYLDGVAGASPTTPNAVQATESRQGLGYQGPQRIAMGAGFDARKDEIKTSEPVTPAPSLTPEQQAAEQQAELERTGQTNNVPAAPTTTDGLRQQHTAAEGYRKEWQARAPGGLRTAANDPEALALYNAENYTRGTGIRAERQTNGNLNFTDGGRTTAQYVGANGQPTARWEDTQDYRDAIVRNLGSEDRGLRRMAMAQAQQLAGERGPGSTGNAEYDRLLGMFGGDPVKASSAYRAIHSTDPKAGATKTPSTADQIKRGDIASGQTESPGEQILHERQLAENGMRNRGHQAGMSDAELTEFTQARNTGDREVADAAVLGLRSALTERQGLGPAVVDGLQGGASVALPIAALEMAKRIPRIGKLVGPVANLFTKGAVRKTASTAAALGGSAVGAARGWDRSVAGRPNEMTIDEFEAVFKNGKATNAVEIDQNGIIRIERNRGQEPVVFRVEDLKKDSIWKDLFQLLTLSGDGQAVRTNVKTLYDLANTKPR